MICETCDDTNCPYCGGPEADYHTMSIECSDCVPEPEPLPDPVLEEIAMIESLTDDELIDHALRAGRMAALDGILHGHYNHGINEVTAAWRARYNKLIKERK